MKKILILLFLFFSSECFAGEISNYSNYYLTGRYKDDFVGNEENKYNLPTDFYIYENKIFLYTYNEMGTWGAGIVPDGKYKLNTISNSKIKIQVNNGEIVNFKILSDKNKFLQNEKEIRADDYCSKSFFYSNFNEAYKIINNVFSIIIGNGEFKNLAILFYKYNENEIIATFFDNHGFLNNNINSSFILEDDVDNISNIYDSTKDFKKVLKTLDTNSNKEPDLIINNCLVEYYNKEKLIFTIIN